MPARFLANPVREVEGRRRQQRGDGSHGIVFMQRL
jgi:hypothetical protein